MMTLKEEENDLLVMLQNSLDRNLHILKLLRFGKVISEQELEAETKAQIQKLQKAIAYLEKRIAA